MTDGHVYVLDANVFIQAARRYYAFDLAPAFWRALVDRASDGQVQSIDRVQQELERGKDELSQWAKSSFHQWFASTAQRDVIEMYRRIMDWVQAQSQFSDAAKSEFAKGADGWLIAYAQTRGRVIVTHEQHDPGIRRRIPIPNVCVTLSNVPFIDTFAMLRALGVRLG